MKAGVCTPAPRQRIIDTRMMAGSVFSATLPLIRKTASPKVARAITVSAMIMSVLRGYLSAHTPLKKEISSCGRKEQRVSAVTQMPDEVSSYRFAEKSLLKVIRNCRLVSLHYKKEEPVKYMFHCTLPALFF